MPDLPRAIRLRRMALDLLWHSGLARLLRPWTGGLGTIVMLHHVRPHHGRTFDPHGMLAIEPGFLDAVLASLRRDGVRLATMDEVAASLAGGDRRPFVCLTADDGYRDNLEHALPVLERHRAPLTLYATTGFIDGTHHAWWLVLEEAVAARARVVFAGETLETADLAGKQRAFARINRRFFAADAAEMRALTAALAADNGIDAAALHRRLFCTWDELRRMAATGLVTLGCHSVSHAVLARETEAQARAELEDARDRIAAETGAVPRHLAYPYGLAGQADSREFALAAALGFETAVTARKAAVQAEHAAHPHALPRVDLTPTYQGHVAAMRAILAGLPLLLWNRGRRVVVE